MFLSKIFNQLRNPTKPSLPISQNNIVDISKCFKSRIKLSKKARLQRLENNPKFKKISIMKMPDFKSENISFPYNIPIRFRYIYRPIKHRPKIPYHDFINFKNMTGNEILINLENAANLRPSELCSALSELAKRPKANEINWNDHEWIKSSVDIVIKKAPQYSPRVISHLVWAFYKLKITEPMLWNVLQKESSKGIHKLRPQGFGAIFIAYMDDAEKSSKEFRERLVSLLPLHVRKMNPNLFTKCFELTMKQGLVNDYIFDSHLFWLVWKRNHWYGPGNYPTLIKCILDYNYTTDINFWNDEFIPTIMKFGDKLTEETAKNLLESLNLIKEKVSGAETEKAENYLKNQIVYINTKVKAVENVKFWNMVKNDMEYYKQKERLKLEEKDTKQLESGSTQWLYNFYKMNQIQEV